MAAILSLYGLAMYHYYLGRSAPTSYYVVCIPYVFILGFLGQAVLDFKQDTRRRVFCPWGLLSLCLIYQSYLSVLSQYFKCFT